MRETDDEYWRRHSLEWESGAYAEDADLPVHTPWIERLATPVRGRSTYRRMTAAIDLLRPHLRNAHVVDIGCASGRFSEYLIAAGADSVTGIDISESAIAVAGERHGSERVRFEAMDPTQPGNPLPPADIYTALGVLEYLSDQQLQTLGRNLQGDRVLFHFVNRPAGFRARIRFQLRRIYLKLKNGPTVYFRSLDEVSRLLDLPQELHLDGGTFASSLRAP